MNEPLPLAMRSPEARQGMDAYRRGVKREDNPYAWVGNNRMGDRKRASWELGWDHAKKAASGDEPVTRARTRAI